jgi:hypothetical protein
LVVERSSAEPGRRRHPSSRTLLWSDFSLGATWASFVQQVLLSDNDLGSHLLDGSWALPKTLEGSDVQEQIGSPISTI